MVQPRTVQGALKVTLQTNFSQISCSMSAKAFTSKPASRQTASSSRRRSDRPPCISPMRIRFMAL
jgi:hypothetical protein